MHSWVQPPILTFSSNLAIVAKLDDPKCLQPLHSNSDVTSFSCLIQSRRRQVVNCGKHRFSPWSINFSQTKLIDNYFRHQTPCSIRKLTAAFVSKIGVFSRFSWMLHFGAKMAEFPLPVLQIWRSRKRVAIQIQLMNIHVSECKYCLHLFPKFGDEHYRQNWRLLPTGAACVRINARWRRQQVWIHLQRVLGCGLSQ